MHLLSDVVVNKKWSWLFDVKLEISSLIFDSAGKSSFNSNISPNNGGNISVLLVINPQKWGED